MPESEMLCACRCQLITGLVAGLLPHIAEPKAVKGLRIRVHVLVLHDVRGDGDCGAFWDEGSVRENNIFEGNAVKEGLSVGDVSNENARFREVRRMNVQRLIGFTRWDSFRKLSIFFNFMRVLFVRIPSSSMTALISSLRIGRYSEYMVRSYMAFSKKFDVVWIDARDSPIWESVRLRGRPRAISGNQSSASSCVFGGPAGSLPSRIMSLLLISRCIIAVATEICFRSFCMQGKNQCTTGRSIAGQSRSTRAASNASMAYLTEMFCQSLSRQIESPIKTKEEMRAIEYGTLNPKVTSCHSMWDSVR